MVEQDAAKVFPTHTEDAKLFDRFMRDLKEKEYRIQSSALVYSSD